jgi:hypothetical protein
LLVPDVRCVDVDPDGWLSRGPVWPVLDRRRAAVQDVLVLVVNALASHRLPTSRALHREHELIVVAVVAAPLAQGLVSVV